MVIGVRLAGAFDIIGVNREKNANNSPCSI